MAEAGTEARARAGDPEAFGSLIREWDHDLRGVVWSVLGSADATEQAMHTAYERAFRSIDRFDGSASLRMWMHTICLRTAIDATRADGDEGAPPDVGFPVPVTPADRVFDSLEGTDRLLLMLTLGLDYGVDEVATLTGVSQDAVVSRVTASHGAVTAAMQPSTAETDAGRSLDEELHERLQTRIPTPNLGYWPDIDARLAALHSPAVDPNGSEGSFNRTRILLAVAGVCVIAALAVLGFRSLGDDDPAGLATTSDQASTDDSAEGTDDPVASTTADGSVTTAATEEDGNTTGDDTSAAGTAADDEIVSDSPSAEPTEQDTDDEGAASSTDPASAAQAAAAEQPPVVDLMVDERLDGATLSSAGLGPIAVGMSVPALADVLGVEEVPLRLSSSVGVHTCGWVGIGRSESATSVDAVIGIDVTGASEGVVQRIIVFSDRWATPSGVRVGMTEQDLVDTFGDRVEARNNTVAPGAVWTFLPNDPNDPYTVHFVVTFENVLHSIHVGVPAWPGIDMLCEDVP
ncbi:MAG: sigma factor [Actinomycetota bacterium]